MLIVGRNAQAADSVIMLRKDQLMLVSKCKYLGSILASDYYDVGLSQLLEGIYLQQPPFVIPAYYAVFPQITHREAAASECLPASETRQRLILKGVDLKDLSTALSCWFSSTVEQHGLWGIDTSALDLSPK